MQRSSWQWSSFLPELEKINLFSIHRVDCSVQPNKILYKWILHFRLTDVVLSLPGENWWLGIVLRVVSCGAVCSASVFHITIPPYKIPGNYHTTNTNTNNTIFQSAIVPSVFPHKPQFIRRDRRERGDCTEPQSPRSLFFLVERGDRAWEEVIMALSNQGCQFWCLIFSHKQRVDIKFDNLNNVTYQVYNSKYPSISLLLTFKMFISTDSFCNFEM